MIDTKVPKEQRLQALYPYVRDAIDKLIQHKDTAPEAYKVLLERMELNPFFRKQVEAKAVNVMDGSLLLLFTHLFPPNVPFSDILVNYTLSVIIATSGAWVGHPATYKET